MKKYRKNYASKLTKEDLIKAGIVAVDPETAKVYGPNGERAVVINNCGYFMINIYDLDKNGNKIIVPIKKRCKGCKKISDTYTYKQKVIGLHRVIWAWVYGEVPEGYVVDHINNQHSKLEDYKIKNLQCITPAQNLAKERPEASRMIKCYSSLEYCEQKLNEFLAKYEQAKKDHDAERAHCYRASISNYKAKIRYILNKDKVNQD